MDNNERLSGIYCDFDETLTKTHTGGALQFRRIGTLDGCTPARDARGYDLHRNFDDTGDESVLENAASGDIAWTFRWIYNLVLRRGVCFAIVTMADVRHGMVRDSERPVDSQRYETLAGQHMVDRWLRCAALAANDFDWAAANEQINALYSSGKFVIIAGAHKSHKAHHIAEAAQYFERNRHWTHARADGKWLFLDNCATVVDETKRRVPNVIGVHVPLGIDQTVWKRIVDSL